MVFSVVFVCTGNICRSPAAEYLFRARTSGLPVVASSAGTSGLSGHEMDQASAFALRELGVDASGHVARRLTPAMFEAADLVLTADTAHRSAVVQSDPQVFRRAFTLREFARLGAELGALDGPCSPSVLRTRVGLVSAQRGWVAPAAPGADDIADPFGAGLEVARTTVRAIAIAVDGAVAALGLRATAELPPA